MIVIPALGRPGRSDEIPPEWLRPAERGSSLLDGFLSALSGTVQAAGLLIIHLDRPGVAEFLRARLAGSGLDAELVALSRPTRGEAETVRLGLGAIGGAVLLPRLRARFGGDVTGLVPDSVREAMAEKYR